MGATEKKPLETYADLRPGNISQDSQNDWGKGLADMASKTYSEQAVVNPTRDENVVGIFRARFTAHAHPFHGFVKDEWYQVKLWSDGKNVYVKEQAANQFGYNDNVTAVYQSWTEFYKNWDNVTQQLAYDLVMPVLEQLEKATYDMQDKLRSVRDILAKIK